MTIDNELFRGAERIAGISLSPIVKMAEAARERRAEGHDIISLGIGEPDFTTPPHVQKAAIAAIVNNDTRYPPTAGVPALRAAVAASYSGLNADNVIVSSGSKYAIFNGFLATLNPGDEVIIPAPYWASYADIVRLCGGSVVPVETTLEDGFIVSPDAIAAKLTPKTRWLLLTSPNNPTGAVLSPATLKGIGAVLKDYPNCWLMSDEIYQHLTYDIDFNSVYDVLPELRGRMMVANGVSKSYAMTGWRVGFGIAPAALIKAMTAIQGQGTSGTCTISQAAALAALTGTQDFLVSRRCSFQERRDLTLAHLNAIDGLKTPVPQGAFYSFSSWASLRGGKTPSGEVLTSDDDFCRYILEAANTVIIPGSAFALDGYFRISYATAVDKLEQALNAMAAAIKAIE